MMLYFKQKIQRCLPNRVSGFITPRSGGVRRGGSWCAPLARGADQFLSTISFFSLTTNSAVDPIGGCLGDFSDLCRELPKSQVLGVMFRPFVTPGQVRRSVPLGGKTSSGAHVRQVVVPTNYCRSGFILNLQKLRGRGIQPFGEFTRLLWNHWLSCVNDFLG